MGCQMHGDRHSAPGALFSGLDILVEIVLRSLGRAVVVVVVLGSGCETLEVLLVNSCM